MQHVVSRYSVPPKEALTNAFAINHGEPVRELKARHHQQVQNDLASMLGRLGFEAQEQYARRKRA